MYLDLNFYIEIFAAALFILLFFASLLLALRSKKQYKPLLFLIALISLFCVLDQAVLFFGAIYFANFKDFMDGITVAAMALTSLVLTKNIAKLT